MTNIVEDNWQVARYFEDALNFVQPNRQMIVLMDTISFKWTLEILGKELLIRKWK